MLGSDYLEYLDDQRSDTIGGSSDDAYLKFLTSSLLLSENFKNKKILDIGCRVFDSYNYFDALGADIVGVDIGKDGLEYCKKNNRPCLDQDAHYLDQIFQPETFDLIITFHALEHMYDLPLVLKHCYNLLKLGGYFYYAVPAPSAKTKRGHWYGIDSDEHMINLVCGAGFQRDKIIHAKHYTEYFRIADEAVGLVRK
jgi:2-polyprenyl-3-methyl-5-hydroxy-6-metoxy-1,4-benzoquinol methylase